MTVVQQTRKPKMSRTAKRGLQFEMFLEGLLRSLGHQNVRRNVFFHKDRHVYRQADITYDICSPGCADLVLVEAKYSSNGIIHYELRGGEKRKAGQLLTPINNLVDEVEERRQFIGARSAWIVTNGRFEPLVWDRAQTYGILLLEGDALARTYRSVVGKSSLESAIHAVDTHGGSRRNTLQL